VSWDSESAVRFPQGLLSAVRYKAFKKRPLRSTRLTLGEGFAIGVQLFALIKPAPRAAHVYVSAKDHDLLKTEGADICEDTGAPASGSKLLFSLLLSRKPHSALVQLWSRSLTERSAATCE